MTDAFGCSKTYTVKVVEPMPPGIMNLDDIYYCSLQTKYPPTVGWFGNPMATVTIPYGFQWTYNGSAVTAGTTPWNIPYQGDGTYTVTITTPCYSLSFTFVVMDLLVEYINHPFATPTTTSQTSSTVTFGRLNPFPPFPSYSWQVNDGGTIYTGTGSTITVPYTAGSGVNLTVTCILKDPVNCRTYRNTINWSDGPAKKRNVLKNANTGIGLPGMQLYPNPGSDVVQLELDDFDLNAQYIMTIYDATGKVVVEENIQNALTRVDVSGFENGLYIVEVRSGENTIRERLVKN